MWALIHDLNVKHEGKAFAKRLFVAKLFIEKKISAMREREREGRNTSPMLSICQGERQRTKSAFP